MPCSSCHRLYKCICPTVILISFSIPVTAQGVPVSVVKYTSFPYALHSVCSLFIGAPWIPLDVVRALPPSWTTGTDIWGDVKRSKKAVCLVFFRLDAVSVVTPKHTRPPTHWGKEKLERLEELRQSIPEKDLFYFPLICEVFRQEKQPEDRYWKMNQRTDISAIN